MGGGGWVPRLMVNFYFLNLLFLQQLLLLKRCRALHLRLFYPTDTAVPPHHHHHYNADKLAA